jgi:heme/copper-type cytochrome/quinol oxidase subunit 2
LLALVFIRLLFLDCGDEHTYDEGMRDATANANLHDLNRVTQITNLEVLWACTPFLVLLILSVPSAIFLFYADGGVYCLDAEYEIVIIGNQWYWVYEY